MCVTGVIRSSGLTFDVLGSKFRRPRLSEVKPFLVSFAQPVHSIILGGPLLSKTHGLSNSIGQHVLSTS
jgi:hypothetical protein